MEICLEITGDPPQVCMHAIDRSGDPSRTVLLKRAPLASATPADRGGSLDGYLEDDATLVASGKSLLDILSSGEVGAEWQRLRQEHNSDLCTYLHVPSSELAKLPWELITDGLLPIVTATPLIRVPVRHPPSDAFKPVWPVRVFVINGSDPDDTGIQAEQEIWNIRQALRKAEHSFDLEVYDVAAADANFAPDMLVDAMKQRWPRGPHIVHFIGHSIAGLKPALQYYVSAAQEYRDWSLAMIAGAMLQFPDLRLVYVNACRSHEAGQNPVTPWSIAGALLRRAAAVIAMQSDISGEAAVAGARAFYDALADGQPVDRALVSVRQMLLNRFGETRRDLYAPVLTTRVAASDILPVRRFGWDGTKHSAWQSLLKENWSLFVNQHSHRRRLYNALFETGPGQSGLIVLGDNSVGKSWLVKWFTYAMAMNELQAYYLPADQSADWLELLRRLRDGYGTLNCPGLEPEVRSEFNWKLEHLARGQQPPPYVSGTVVPDTAGSHADIMQQRPVNGFDAKICEAMVHALRQQTRRTHLVLVLDNPSLPMVATLKAPFLDALVGRAAIESIRVILCCDSGLWESYRAQYLDFSGWQQILVSEIDQRQVGTLIFELLRLHCPDCEETKAQRLAELEGRLKNLPTKAMKAADLYATSSRLYTAFVDV